MNRLGGILKVIGPRLLAAIAAMASTKLAEKGITVDPATLVGIGLGTYAAVHKALSAKVNPGDAATGRVATGIDKAANDPAVDTVVRIPDTH